MTEKKRELYLYELPCYPNTEPEDNSRTIVNLHENFCGRPGVHVFIGGGGVAHFKTRSAALNAVPALVRERLQDRRDEAKRYFEYAQRMLDDWDTDPEKFLPKIGPEWVKDAVLEKLGA